MTQSSHVFVVGSYRSGTSLMRNILNCSPDVAICGETHFLGSPRTLTSFQKFCLNSPEQSGFYQQAHLLQKPAPLGSWQSLMEIGDFSTDAGIKKAVGCAFKSSLAYWRWAAGHVDCDEFSHKFLASERDERVFFDLMMAFYAGDKPIRGEKTPHHIHHVPTLLEWFPQAKVIHMFRDVRPIYVSEQKKKFKQKNARISSLHRLLRRSAGVHQVYMSLNIIIHWRRLVQLHYQYQRLYPHNYYLCKFEELVSKPNSVLEDVCKFLEIDFVEPMLDQPVQNSSFMSSQPVSGLDASVAHRWREHLHPVINSWLVWGAKKRLLELNYQL